jgi:hypothetical protein
LTILINSQFNYLAFPIQLSFKNISFKPRIGVSALVTYYTKGFQTMLAFG